MKPAQAPPEEQSICVSCGFCCDGTLFLHAHLNEGERGHLPVKIEQACFTEKEKDYFMLPCLYFSGKCTIYDKKKADVCSDYRCQLLKDFAKGKITLNDALETVVVAIQLRTEILTEARKVTGQAGIVFRQFLSWLGKKQKLAGADLQLSDDLEMLLVKCNIFEALLIRHFRSAEEFDKMIMK
jgi:hypothetical protein